MDAREALQTYLESQLASACPSLEYYPYDPTSGNFKRPFLAVPYGVDRKSRHTRTIGGTWRDYDFQLLIGASQSSSRDAADQEKMAMAQAVRDALDEPNKNIGNGYMVMNVAINKAREPVDREKNMITVSVEITDKP